MRIDAMTSTSLSTASGEGLASPDKETIQHLFDRIAFRYDKVNSVLSLSLDETWRRRAVNLILNESPDAQTLLDLGVGTGKFLARFLQKKSWQLAAGVDFSEEMLGRARQLLPPGYRLFKADIHFLPFDSESFDLIVSSFTLRSVKDRAHFFEEVCRILRPNGKAAFLCLTRPTSFVGKALYAPYLKFYLPIVGGLLAGNRTAYRFLSESIQAFPSPPEIADELRTHGFQTVSIFPFTLGISTLILGRR